MSSGSKAATLLHRLRAVPGPAQASPSLLLMSQLRDLGWHESVRRHAPVDAQGRPRPWLTIPANAWLASAVRPSDTVWEFGAGNSTMWFAERVASVVSVESDRGWHDRLRGSVPANVDLRYVPADPADAYAAAIDIEGTFDVVVVDGVARPLCVEHAVDHVADDGFLVLDDADRAEYATAHTLLDGAGFGRIDFMGLRLGVGHVSTTSVFSRAFGGRARGNPPPTPTGF